jgi:hypothetical protein
MVKKKIKPGMQILDVSLRRIVIAKRLFQPTKQSYNDRYQRAH